ncbi:MAG TPA: alpha-glucosidase C-terminal domain-containing protein, partial [Chloroflexia bacterium]|nr:alpha-glucosidase C-terminal domain-containing protein [Chloroflexia bacterium]
GDARIAGMGASLAGLELALQADQAGLVDLAIRRILLIHGVILTIGGIPLIYLNDEVGTLNDYRYRTDPAKAGDSRWVHRPVTDWARLARRADPNAVEGRVFGALQRLIGIRQAHAAFAGHDTLIFDTGAPAVFGYVRQQGGERVLALANFSEQAQQVPANELRVYGLSYTFTDLVSGAAVALDQDIVLDPYRFLWLVAGA